MSIVTLTFDLWPPKSIGCILSSRLTCLPSLIKKSTTVKSLLCSQAYFHRCPVWPWPLTSKINRVHPLITVNMSCKFDDLWPLTSKINRVHPLITVNMSCKFDKEICNGLVSMVFTSVTIKKVWLPDRQTHAHTDRRRTKWSLCAAMLRRRHNNKNDKTKWLLCESYDREIGTRLHETNRNVSLD